MRERGEEDDDEEEEAAPAVRGLLCDAVEVGALLVRGVTADESLNPPPFELDSAACGTDGALRRRRGGGPAWKARCVDVDEEEEDDSR